MVTGPGSPNSGTARTSDGGAIGGRDREPSRRGRSRHTPSVKAPAVAPTATAASEMMTGFGTCLEVRTAFDVGDAPATLLPPVGGADAPAPEVGGAEAEADGEAVADTGVAETSPESFRLCLAALTAATLK